MDDPERTGGQDDEDIARLVKLGGLRPAPPDQRLERLRGAAHAEWTQVVELRRRRRLTVGTAVGLAAALLLAVRLVPDREPAPDVPPTITATLALASGPVQRAPRTGAGPTVTLQVGDVVTERDLVETPMAVVAAFTLAGGASLRVNEQTRVQIESPTVVRMERGAVYLDTGTATPGTAVEVRTPFGVMRDIGTQFEVNVTELQARVRVRDGEVVLIRNDAETRAGRGTQLVAAADGVTASAVPVFGADWEWVNRAPSPFDLSTHTLMEFVEWVTRETGYAVAFESEDLAAKARRMTVQGSIDGLTAHEALEAVLPATGLEYRVNDGRITIRTQ